MLRIKTNIARIVCYRGLSTHASSRPSAIVDKFLRVDHAGELGADRIYAGQMAVLGKTILLFHSP